ncbi:MAG: hypothetical protein ACRDJC_19980 [Thermomicrobiales bacterium]
MEAEGITAALRPVGADVSQATVLAENRGRAFQGPIPVGEGFVIPAEEAERLRGQPDADYAQVVRRYLIGKDIANDPTQGQADGSSTLGS